MTTAQHAEVIFDGGAGADLTNRIWTTLIDWRESDGSGRNGADALAMLTALAINVRYVIAASGAGAEDMRELRALFDHQLTSVSESRAAAALADLMETKGQST